MCPILALITYSRSQSQPHVQKQMQEGVLLHLTPEMLPSGPCTASRWGSAGEEVDDAVREWASASGEEATALQAARRLAGACQPLYRHLFVPISQQPGGPFTIARLWVVKLRRPCIASESIPSWSGHCFAPAGILFLMNFRADARRLLHEQPAGAIALRALDTAVEARIG